MLTCERIIGNKSPNARRSTVSDNLNLMVFKFVLASAKMKTFFYISKKIAQFFIGSKFSYFKQVYRIRKNNLNLELVLKAAGLEKKDVAMCRIYIPNVKYWEDLNEAYAEFFGTHRPARVVVPSNNLHHGCLVEVEAVAERR